MVSKFRSKNTMIIAAVMIGIAKTVRNATTSIIHVNTGIRMSVMPGARMFRMVTMKLIADVVDPMPRKHDADDPEVGAVAREARRWRADCS